MGGFFRLGGAAGAVTSVVPPLVLTGGALSVNTQSPTANSTIPSAPLFELADGSYLTLAQVLTLVGGGTPAETAMITQPSGTYTSGSPIHATGTLANGTALWASLTIGGTEQLPRVAATVTGSTWAADVPTTAAGSPTMSVYAASTGGPALFTTTAITVGAATSTITSVTVPSSGTSIVLALSQQDTLTNVAGFVLTPSDGITWSNPTVPATTFTGTLASTIYSTDTPHYSAAINLTGHGLAAAITAAAVINNSTQSAVSLPTVTSESPTYGPGKFGQGLATGAVFATASGAGGSRTVECWLTFTTLPGQEVELVKDFDGPGNIGLSAGGLAKIGAASYDQTGGSTPLNDGISHHIATVLDNATGLSTLYVDGINVNQNNYGYGGGRANPTYYVMGSGASTVVIGGATATRTGQGVIDEVRISNIARYTANFTPPTAPFTHDANTLLLFHFDSSAADS